jgi:hypothetical protein
MSELFERASRAKLRFETTTGTLTVEDLWQLPLSSERHLSLDDVAKATHRELQEAKETSFVEAPTAGNTELQLRFDVVKHVIDVKLAERDEAKTRAENKAKKQRLLELIAEKKDEGLKAASVEELEAMVVAL